MSRIGKSPVEIPAGVKLTVARDSVLVEGPKGKLTTPIPKGIRLDVEGNQAQAVRSNDESAQRALHGLTRALLANAVTGVTQGFSKELDVVGIGYKAEMRGKYLNLSLGYSHPIEYRVPEGIQIKVERGQRPISNYVATIIVSGIDKAKVGQVCAEIRAMRTPDAYKGKGIRYSQETVKLKVGKKGA